MICEFAKKKIQNYKKIVLYEWRTFKKSHNNNSLL